MNKPIQIKRALLQGSYSTWLFACASLLLFGCTSQPLNTNQESKSLSESLLEKIGLQKVSVAQAEKKNIQPYDIDLSILAGDNLNAGSSPKANSIVIRIYHLRAQTAFEQLTIADVQSSEAEKQLLNDSLIAVRELVLVPGQQVHLKESVPRDATAIGIIALFHSAAKHRWKFAFDTAAAASSGITIGIHACAMTITRGEPLRTNEWRDDALLARTRCMEQ